MSGEEDEEVEEVPEDIAVIKKKKGRVVRKVIESEDSEGPSTPVGRQKKTHPKSSQIFDSSSTLAGSSPPITKGTRASTRRQHLPTLEASQTSELPSGTCELRSVKAAIHRKGVDGAGKGTTSKSDKKEGSRKAGRIVKKT